MDKTYRVGIVGCGRIAPAHVTSMRATGRAEIVAIADIKPEALQAFGDKHGIAARYPSHTAMLAAEKLDVVVVATWPGSHAEITIDAARASVPGVLCDKPMAPSLEEAAAMLRVCRESGTRLAVGHQHRYDLSWNRAREMVAEGAIGAPLLALTKVTDGLINNGTHFIDGIRYILGDPEPVWAMAQVERRTDRHERGEPIEDSLMGTVAFAGGAQALIEVDLPPVEGATPWPYSFIGTQGTLYVNWTSLALVSASGKQEWWWKLQESAHDRQAADFLRWLDGEVEDFRGAGEKAYQTVAVMMSLYESVRSRGVVRFPLAEGPSPLKVMLADGALPVEVSGYYDIRA